MMLQSNLVRLLVPLALSVTVSSQGIGEPVPLRVSPSGRSLVDGEGRRVFLIGDTAWSLAFRTTREDAAFYLQTRKAQGFNTVTFALVAPGKSELTDTLRNVYGDEPFASDGDRPDPTRPLVTEGADPGDAVAYDYWDHVDHIVDLAGGLGLHVILLPTWGSGVSAYNGSGANALFDEAGAYTYARWLGERYRDQPQVMWMVGGDRAATLGEHDHRSVFRAFARGLKEGAPRALLSFHSRKGAPQSGASFHDETWLDFNSLQAWPERQIGLVTSDWIREPAKPTWLFEGRYEGYWRANNKAEDWGEWQVRQQAYQTVLSGAFGHVYGHERIFGFGFDGAKWREFMDTPGARSTTHLVKAMSALDPTRAFELEPDQSLIDGEAGEASRIVSDRITAARSSRRGLAVIYSASGKPFRLRLDSLKGEALFGWWYNPRTGGWHVDGAEFAEARPFARGLPSGAGAPVSTFTPPTEGANKDWLLILGPNEPL